MSEWDSDPFAEDSAPLRDSEEAGASVEDSERSTGSDGEGESGALVVPDFMRKAMEAHGVDPDAVAAAAASGDVIPSDEQAVFVEAARRTGGMRCEGCKGKVDANDQSILVEVIGWSKHRSQGGQNHVIDRAETGRVMCGECGSRLIHLGSVGYAQESMV